MSIGNHEALIRPYFASFFTGSIDIYDRLLHPRFYVCHLRDKGTPVAEARRGPEPFKRALPAFRAAFPDGQITVDTMVGDAEIAIASWRFQGSHHGEFLGVAPTGKQITYPGVNGFRIQDSQLIESWDLQDSLGLFQQLGLLPETAAIFAAHQARTSTGS